MNDFNSMKPLFKEQYASHQNNQKRRIAILLAEKKKKGQLNNSSQHLPVPEKVTSPSFGFDHQSEIDPNDPFKKKLFPNISKLFK